MPDFGDWQLKWWLKVKTGLQLLVYYQKRDLLLGVDVMKYNVLGLLVFMCSHNIIDTTLASTLGAHFISTGLSFNNNFAKVAHS